MGGGLYLSKSSLSNVCAASIQVTEGPCRECLACPSLVCNRWGRPWVTCLRLRPLWTAWVAWARWVPQLVSDGLLRQCAVSASRQGMGMNDMGLGPGAMTMGKAVGPLAVANSLPRFLSLLVQGDPMMGKGDMGKGSKAPQMHADALVAGNLSNLPLGSSFDNFFHVVFMFLFSCRICHGVVCGRLVAFAVVFWTCFCGHSALPGMLWRILACCGQSAMKTKATRSNL